MIHFVHVFAYVSYGNFFFTLLLLQRLVPVHPLPHGRVVKIGYLSRAIRIAHLTLFPFAVTYVALEFCTHVFKHRQPVSNATQQDGQNPVGPYGPVGNVISVNDVSQLQVPAPLSQVSAQVPCLVDSSLLPYAAPFVPQVAGFQPYVPSIQGPYENTGVRASFGGAAAQGGSLQPSPYFQAGQMIPHHAPNVTLFSRRSYRSNVPAVTGPS